MLLMLMWQPVRPRLPISKVYAASLPDQLMLWRGRQCLTACAHDWSISYAWQAWLVVHRSVIPQAGQGCLDSLASLTPWQSDSRVMTRPLQRPLSALLGLGVFLSNASTVVVKPGVVVTTHGNRLMVATEAEGALPS